MKDVFIEFHVCILNFYRELNQWNEIPLNNFSDMKREFALNDLVYTCDIDAIPKKFDGMH